jgi:hypothetical protein
VNALMQGRQNGLRVLRTIVLGILFALIPIARAAAVSVSPNALYLDNRTRSGLLTLFNPGSLPEEIEIGFAFGYPMSDSLGNVSVQLVGVAPEGEPSLVPWLRAFPLRLRLAPGQRQVIRILANPPANLPLGEYLGRITVTSRGGQPPIEQRQGDISLSVSLQTVIVAAVTYRNGPMQTGLQIGVGSARAHPVGAELLLDLTRQGNAAFIGRLVAQVVSPTGQVVAEDESDVAVYRQLRARVIVPMKDKPADLTGYKIRFAIDTQRPDLPPEGPIPTSRLTGEIPIT